MYKYKNYFCIEHIFTIGLNRLILYTYTLIYIRISTSIYKLFPYLFYTIINFIFIQLTYTYLVINSN